MVLDDRMVRYFFITTAGYLKKPSRIDKIEEFELLSRNDSRLESFVEPALGFARRLIRTGFDAR